MGIYKLVNDDQHIGGEEDKYQFGETNTVYDVEREDCDFIAESDSSIMGLFACGLRTFENGAFGCYDGRRDYVKANGEDAGYKSKLSGGVVQGGYVNPVNNDIEKYNPYLLDFQNEWAARADRCVAPYDECNRAPVIYDVTADATVAPGASLELNASISDSDGGECMASWSADATGSVFIGEGLDRPTAPGQRLPYPRTPRVATASY